MFDDAKALYLTCNMKNLSRPLIGIDCRFAASQSGIGRYIRELVHHLLKRDDPWRYVLFTAHSKEHGLTNINAERADHCPLATCHYSLTEQLTLPFLIKKHHIDLLHVPHFNIPLLSPVKIITTIHDLTLHHYPNEASIAKRLVYRVLMRAAVKRSKHILTVSNATAGEISQTYGSNISKKMTVTYEGVSPHFHHADEEAIQHIREKYNLYDKFILYVGAAKEHKNIQSLIDAMPHTTGIDAAMHTENLLLVLVTGGKEVFRLRLTPDVRILSDVTDEELPALYSSAECFVLPSLYEGFGLPALEAMACGCRTVVSNRTSLPEICGKHAIVVEPTVDGLSKGIHQALEENSDSTAIHHAQLFSWKKMAEQTAGIYHDVLF